MTGRNTERDLPEQREDMGEFRGRRDNVLLALFSPDASDLSGSFDVPEKDIERLTKPRNGTCRRQCPGLSSRMPFPTKGIAYRIALSKCVTSG
jgi:hypothetical protein